MNNLIYKKKYAKYKLKYLKLKQKGGNLGNWMRNYHKRKYHGDHYTPTRERKTGWNKIQASELVEDGGELMYSLNFNEYDFNGFAPGSAHAHTPPSKLPPIVVSSQRDPNFEWVWHEYHPGSDSAYSVYTPPQTAQMKESISPVHFVSSPAAKADGSQTPSKGMLMQNKSRAMLNWGQARERANVREGWKKEGRGSRVAPAAEAPAAEAPAAEEPAAGASAESHTNPENDYMSSDSLESIEIIKNKARLKLKEIIEYVNYSYLENSVILFDENKFFIYKENYKFDMLMIKKYLKIFLKE